MPCNCDHMEPTSKEVELSQIACLLDELRTGKKKINKTYWNGYHPDVYSQTYDRYLVKDGKKFPPGGMKQLLVDKIKALPKGKIKEQSLEMQMWWRDYVVNSKVEIARRAYEEEQEKFRKSGLAKLTEEEQKALGVYTRRERRTKP